MKRLLMFAVLAVTGFTATAQFAHNNTGCDMEYRELCVDVSTSPNCTIVNMGPWTPAPANQLVWFAPSICNVPPDEVAYEVRYNTATTGCVGSVIVKPGAICNGMTFGANLPFCPCNPNPAGPHVHFNGLNLHIDP